MARTACRPFLALGLIATGLGYIGCDQGTKSSPAPPPPPESETTAQVRPSPPPTAAEVASPPAESKGKSKYEPFANWPVPLGALLISGEQNGYLEPCGCTQGQQGGLLRRYELAEQLRARKWPLALVDLGGLMKDPAGARGGPEQANIKFTTALKALTLMKYDALALSAEDLKLGVGEALGQFLNMGDHPKVVVANVEAPGCEAVVLPSLRTQAGPVKLGITAVLDPDAFQKLADTEKDALLKIKPIAATLPAVLADLEKDTDVQILMVQGPPEAARPLAEAYPGFDLVIGTSLSDPDADPERLNDGKTLLVTVGTKGKYAGVIGFCDDPAQKLRYQRVLLDRHYDGPAAPMSALVRDGYRNGLKSTRTVENFLRRDYIDGAPGARFIGAESCKSCHPNTFARWSGTRHAHAFESLEKDPKPNTIFDAECITCHTTGFEYTSGWRAPEKTPALKGNQCENCHGPASKHVADPDNPNFRKPLALTAVGADQNRLCLRCHDDDNSPKFKFDTYYGQIVHKGMDTYDDPKVHQGRPAK